MTLIAVRALDAARKSINHNLRGGSRDELAPPGERALFSRRLHQTHAGPEITGITRMVHASKRDYTEKREERGRAEESGSTGVAKRRIGLDRIGQHEPLTIRRSCFRSDPARPPGRYAARQSNRRSSFASPFLSLLCVIPLAPSALLGTPFENWPDRPIKHLVVIFGENISRRSLFPGRIPMRSIPRASPRSARSPAARRAVNGLKGSLLTHNPGLNAANGAGAANPVPPHAQETGVDGFPEPRLHAGAGGVRQGPDGSLPGRDRHARQRRDDAERVDGDDGQRPWATTTA